MSQIQNDVKEYYGETLSSNKDLKTNACSTDESIPDYLKPLLSNIHDEVAMKYYGCGSPIPLDLEGKTVLDLGCGTGRDCFLLSQLVGENGRVIGVDMTDAQLEVAQKHIQWHMDKFGYSKTNVEIKKGVIEDLGTAGIEDNSVDLVISNCVINLSEDKEAVFREIFRVLKPGGELFFSDVFSLRRIPEELKKDKELLGECLSGALYVEDFRRLLIKLGYPDFRVYSEAPLLIDKKEKEVYRKIGMIPFTSMTVRAFKCDFEDRCEEYGHIAYYLGTMNQAPHEFKLEEGKVFIKGLPLPVCGNSAQILTETRFNKHFTVVGDFETHYGLFSDSRDLVEGGCADSDNGGGCC